MVRWLFMNKLRFTHIGVAVADIGKACEVYQNLFGHRILSGPVEDPIQDVVVCFVGSGMSGDLVVELVAPRSTQSPVTQILAKGGGGYHVCYETDDLDAFLAKARESRCLIVSGPVPAAAFDGKRISWLYTPARQLLEVVEA